MQTGVTKALQLNIHIIMLAELKADELLAKFFIVPSGLTQVIPQFVAQSKVLYNICKLLSCYLMNKIQLDYPTSQAKTRKQLKQENYMLACEIQRFLLDKIANPFGPGFNPMLRLLNNKFINEAIQFIESYRKTELHNVKEPELLNLSLNDIISKYQQGFDPHDDMVKTNVWDKTKLNPQNQGK